MENEMGMSALAELLAPSEWMVRVHSCLNHWVGQTVPAHLRVKLVPLLTQGKMIRARLLLWLSQAHETLPPRLIAAAALIELMHLASLLHDDVMDRASLRRGHGSLNRSIGDSGAVWMGDLLLLKAVEETKAPGWENARHDVLDTLREMTNGQLLEWLWSGRTDLPEEIYWHLLDAKTGRLFGLAATWGVGETVTRDSRLKWMAWGLCLGRLFQMGDDCLDIWSPKTGKAQGQDWREGRMTLPTIMLRDLDPNAFAQLLRAGAKGDPGDFISKEMRQMLDDAWGVQEQRFLDLSDGLLAPHQQVIVPSVLAYLRHRKR